MNLDTPYRLASRHTSPTASTGGQEPQSSGIFHRLRIFFVVLVIAMVTSPFLAAIAHVTRCISQDGPGVSLCCTSTYVATCSQPAMGLLFRSCRYTATEPTSWIDYLGSLRVAGNLVDSLSRRSHEHLSLTSGMLRSAESIGKHAEDLSETRGTIDVSESASEVVASSTSLASALLDFHNSVELVLQGLWATHEVMAASLNQTRAPLLYYVPLLTPPDAWMASAMFGAAQQALRISIEHLALQRTKVNALQDNVVTALDRVQDTVLSVCSPRLAHSKEPGWAHDTESRQCHRLLQRVEAMRADTAVCAYLTSEMSVQLDEADYDRTEMSARAHAYGAEILSVDAHVVPDIVQGLARFAEASARVRDRAALDTLKQHAGYAYSTS